MPGGKTLAFTGHRPNKYPFLSQENSAPCRHIKEALDRRVDQAIAQGYTHFVCGGALGVDTLAARLILEKREGDARLTLEIVVPCEGQDKYWREEDRRLYADILARADIVTRICSDYTPFCMHERNQYMVELCQKLIAVYDGTKGGTYDTVLLALSEGKEVDVIPPQARSVQ